MTASVNLLPKCGAELLRRGEVVAVCDRRHQHGSIHPLLPVNFHKQKSGPCWPV